MSLEHNFTLFIYQNYMGNTIQTVLFISFAYAKLDVVMLYISPFFLFYPISECFHIVVDAEAYDAHILTPTIFVLRE